MAVPDHGKIAAKTNYIQKYKKYAQHTLVGSSAVHRNFLPNFSHQLDNKLFYISNTCLEGYSSRYFLSQLLPPHGTVRCHSEQHSLLVSLGKTSWKKAFSCNLTTNWTPSFKGGNTLVKGPLLQAFPNNFYYQMNSTVPKQVGEGTVTFFIQTFFIRNKVYT